MSLPENWREWPSGAKQQLLDRLELLAAQVMGDESRLRSIRIVDFEDYDPNMPDEAKRIRAAELMFPGQIHTLIVCRSKPDAGGVSIGTIAEAVAVGTFSE